MSSREPIVDDPDQVVVRDKRRLDPDSGAVRSPAPEAAASAQGGTHTHPGLAGDAGSGGAVAGDPDPAGAEGAAGQADSAPADQGVDPVAELTADLQRVSAEYANYRKRVERDRVAVVEMATAGLLSGLLPVLDDIARARDHDDLNGAFKGVGEAIEALTGKLGLERFGEVGETFDPAVHEAMMAAEPNPDSDVSTCAAVLQPGYRLSGGRVLRPARVSVAEGAGSSPVPAPESVT